MKNMNRIKFLMGNELPFHAAITAAVEKPTPANLNRVRKIAEEVGLTKYEVFTALQDAMPWQPTRKVKCDYDHTSARIPCALGAL